MSGKFELLKAGTQFYFQLKSSNGEILVLSELYESRSAALNGIRSVRENAAKPTRFEQRSVQSGGPYFVLKASNGQVIAQSEVYRAARSMQSGIQSVANHAPDAQINDLTGDSTRSNAFSRFKNALFVSPLVRTEPAGPARNLIKLNRAEAIDFVQNKGGLSQFLMDFSAFNFDQETFDPGRLVAGLESIIDLVRQHPAEVRQILGSVHRRGGFTGEVSEILKSLGLTSLSDPEATGCNMVLMSMTATPLCGCNDIHGPYPGDPNFPEQPDSPGGEDPDPGDDPDSDDDSGDEPDNDGDEEDDDEDSSG